MSPVTHLLASGVLAGWSGLDHRGRIAVMLAGVAPDIDGLGVIPELLTRHSPHPLLWFSNFHHQLHTAIFALLVLTAAILWCARQRWKTAALVLASFHLHLLCDLLGARGPDRDSWPIPYFAPFTQAHAWSWSGQWLLNGWQNFVITGALLVATFWLAVRNGSSVVELFSTRADARFVAALRSRFPLT